MSAGAEVVARVEGRLGRLTLNRPRALHALTTNMCRLMTEAMNRWRDDKSVVAVLIDHAGPRGFCAGGDVRQVSESDRAGAAAFFSAEYPLNALIHDYPKPYIAIIDGVTMGGGVGISIHGAYRVATERTLWAMPETGLGLFPDVGGGWFLPRLRGRLGVYLALTGARLGAADCFYAGLATHIAASSKLDALKAALVAAPHASAIPLILDGFHNRPVAAPLMQHQGEIDRLFASDRAEDIFAALEAEASAWARAELANLRTKSPQTVKVSLRQLCQGARMVSFAENMKMEYRLALRITALPDFREGVRALLVDKDNAPRWRPPTLEAVTEDMLDAIFAPLPPDQELRL
ncbi:MAG TPA: enoyl-CoA hydratase/isomerase family protein [Caulobacterales bacterium]|nr:enoyl-CoA hydratase/isomerase family protein [Caulobacterales bacterium]